jgi:hypothetical protein
MKLLRIENQKTNVELDSILGSIHVSYDDATSHIFAISLKDKDIELEHAVLYNTVMLLLRKKELGRSNIVGVVNFMFNAPIRAYIDTCSGFPELVVMDYYSVEKSSKTNYTKVEI